jgi:hypothetical protein
MLWPQSRVSDLIERLENGDDPTPEEMQRILRLQALDIAKAGEDYVKQGIVMQESADVVLEK